MLVCKSSLMWSQKSMILGCNSVNCLFNHLATEQRIWYPFHHGCTFPQCRPRLSLPWNPSHCLPYWKNSHSRCHDYEIANLHTHTHRSVHWVINSPLFPKQYTPPALVSKHNRPTFGQQIYGSRDESVFSRILNLTGCAQSFTCRLSIFLRTNMVKGFRKHLNSKMYTQICLNLLI